MKKILLSAIAITVLISALSLYSCHGGGGSPSTGTVALYLTDDPMELFSQVTATIERVELISTGTGKDCDILTAPKAVDIRKLSGIMQLVDVRQCPAGPYNRIHINFDKTVQLMSASTATVPSLCSFVSYRDEGSGSQPNILLCDPVSDICTLNINGAVNVFARQSNKMALDFNLKDFDVSGTPACAVTLKVSPLNASDMAKRGSREAITGLVSRLSTTDRTFDLTRGNRTFSVLYSGITAGDQPGLDTLLQRAVEDRLRTKVMTSSIDLTDNTIIASEILVKVEGTVSELVTDAAFSLTYGPDASRNIGIDYGNATVDGVVTAGAWVEVKLYGSSNETNTFLAGKVEVESEGMMTED